MGPNGAGKSTLLKILAGIEREDHGDMGIKKGHGHSIGYVPEGPIFFEDLSAYNNLRYFADLCEESDVEGTCIRLLNDFDLLSRKDDRLSTFSKGMRQRIAIARALIGDPPILLLDEPFSGLDPSMAIGLRELIVGLKKSGRTLFLSSHDLADVEAICDSVAFMKSGKIIDKKSLRSCSQTDVIVQIIFSNKIRFDLSSIDKMKEVRSDNGLDATVVLSKSDIPHMIRDLVEKGAEIEEVKMLNKGLIPLYSELIMGED